MQTKIKTKIKINSPIKNLKALQQSFIKELKNNSQSTCKRDKEQHKSKKPLSPYSIRSAKLIPEKKLWEIYRRHSFYPLFQSLKDTYPICHYFLGEKYFFLLSQLFISQNPSQDPLLLNYGKNFSAFLEITAKEGLNSPLTSKLAKLELAIQRGTLLKPIPQVRLHSYLKMLEKERDSHLILQKHKNCILIHFKAPSPLLLWRQLTKRIEEKAYSEESNVEAKIEANVETKTGIESNTKMKTKINEHLILFKNQKDILEIKEIQAKTFHALKKIESPQRLSQLPQQNLKILSLLLKKGWLKLSLKKS